MVDPTLTTRERYAVHTSNPSCNSCHVLMDPIGLSFESYDGEGKYRTTENGKPVDASGELKFTDVDGTFVGAVALGQKLKSSTRVKDCVQKQYFRYAFGRDVTADDACSATQLKARFQASGYRLSELLLAVTQTDAFLLRRAAP